MKLLEILRFELAYQVRRPWSWPMIGASRAESTLVEEF